MLFVDVLLLFANSKPRLNENTKKIYAMYFVFSVACTAQYHQIPDEKTPSHPIELSTELILATTVVLSPFNIVKQPHPKVLERLPDIVR